MSKDFYFHKVAAFTGNVPAVIHPGSNFLEKNGLYDIQLDRAAKWMLNLGKKTVVEYTTSDLRKLSQDKFGSEHNRAHWLRDGGYELYQGNDRLGIVTPEEVKKYAVVESYEAVVFKREQLFSPDDNYLFHGMEDKLYTAKELLAYADKIEEEYGAEYHYESLLMLYKCARIANEGNLIWVEVG